MNPQPLRPSITSRRLLWRQRLTLCIAAECNYSKTVIFSCDWSSESGSSKAEIQQKFDVLPKSNTPVVFAGTANRALEFLAVLGEFVDGCPKEETLKRLKAAVAHQKRALIDEYIASKIGHDYQWFLTKGKDSLHPDVWRKLSFEIPDIELDCSFIVAMPEGSHFRIYRIHQSGLVEPCENFCAIGSGLEMAESMLFYRKCHASHKAHLALYKVMEAAIFGRHAPHVGENISLMIANLKRGAIKFTTPAQDGWAYLFDAVQKFGPQPIRSLQGVERLVKTWEPRFKS